MLPGRSATVRAPASGGPGRASGGSPPASWSSAGAAWAGAALAVLLRPSLWSTAVSLALAMSPPGWWRRPPFVPVPSRRYLRFRSVTAYGRPTPPRARDLVDYLSWCRDQRRCGGPRR